MAHAELSQKVVSPSCGICRHCCHTFEIAEVNDVRPVFLCLPRTYEFVTFPARLDQHEGKSLPPFSMNRRYYIYLSSVLGHGANLYRVQNGQDGRPLRSHCVRLKYSPRIASNGKEIVRNETDTPTSPSGKDTGIGRRNHAN